MVELACAADPRFLASRIEEGAGKSYSIDTIERVKAGSTDGNGALFFIIGSDAFAEIQTWRRWQDVIRAVEFIVVALAGYDIAGPPGARVDRLDSVELPVSSSDIRDALAREKRLRSCRPRSPCIFAITGCTGRLARRRLNPDVGRVQPVVRHHRDLPVLRHAHDIHHEIPSAKNGCGGLGWLG